MNVVRKSPRLVATGAAAALAAAAMVGMTSTTANAVPVNDKNYTCQNPLGEPWTVTLDSNAVGIDGITTLPAGSDVLADQITVTNNFTIPADAHKTLTDYGVEDIRFPDFAGSFGGNPVGVTGMTAKVSEMTVNPDGSYSFDSNGLNAAFEAPAAGAQPVLSPTGFNMVAFVPALGSDVAVPCGLAEGTTAGTYTTIDVTKNASTVTGKPVARTLKTTKVAKMKVTVAAPNETPTGKVIVKEGTRKLGSASLNDLGKATVGMGKLSKGKHKVTVVYKGDGYTTTGKSDTIVFTVIKP